jgi:hypothetical protein
MTTMTVIPREAAEWTVDDLDRLPDDGPRYELLDGILLVSPAPARLHQRAAFNLGVLLHRVCPAGLEIVAAPLELATGQQDLTAARCHLCWSTGTWTPPRHSR